MSYCLFTLYEGPGESVRPLADHLRTASDQVSETGSARVGLDLFRPEPEPVLLFEDGPGPAAVLTLSCQDAGSLRALLEDEAFHRWAGGALPGLPGDVSASIGLFRTLSFATVGSGVKATRTAGLSFLVRYYGPMPDVGAFQNFYIKNHTPILGRLPGVRNVFCYLPEDLACDVASSWLAPTQILLINEVVFDDVNALNAALESDIVQELKADSARFPAFGHSTHHAIRREPLRSEAGD